MSKFRDRPILSNWAQPVAQDIGRRWLRAGEEIFCIAVFFAVILIIFE